MAYWIRSPSFPRSSPPSPSPGGLRPAQLQAAYGEQATPFVMTVLLAAERFAAMKDAQSLP